MSGRREMQAEGRRGQWADEIKEEKAARSRSCKASAFRLLLFIMR